MFLIESHGAECKATSAQFFKLLLVGSSPTGAAKIFMLAVAQPARALRCERSIVRVQIPPANPSSQTKEEERMSNTYQATKEVTHMI